MVTYSSSGIEPTEGSPSFFKVIRYPSSPHLALPDAFVRNHLEKIPKNPTLRTATGGYSWKLKVIKIGEDFCFAHGWEKLANDVQLCIRDIVVFWLIDPFTFLVSFLNANGCGKDLTLNNQTNNGDESVDGHDDDALCFEKVISMKTHKYSMLLPMSFVKAAGLENKTSIKMKDHKGNEWTLGILVERYGRIKYSLTASWCKFRRYCQLSEGDVCFFKFDKKEGVLNLGNIVRNKRQQQHGIDIGKSVEIEDEWSPVEKPCNNDIKVKVEYESGGEVEVANRKRRVPEKPVRGVKVKLEDESDLLEAVKTKLGRLSVDKPSGADRGAQVESQPERERLSICKRVVYF